MFFRKRKKNPTKLSVCVFTTFMAVNYLYGAKLIFVLTALTVNIPKCFKSKSEVSLQNDSVAGRLKIN